MRRRNTDGDLFVSRLVNCPQADFATAVEEIKKLGMGPIQGSDAEELLCKIEQVTGTILRADKEEIWEVEEWGPDEWVEQTAAETAFAIAMNVHYARRFTAGTCSPQRPVSSRRIASLPRESIRPTLDRHTEHSRTIIAMTAATTNKPIHVSLIPDSLTGLPNNLLIRVPNPARNTSPISSNRNCIPRVLLTTALE
jgi:hypothetical protein